MSARGKFTFRTSITFAVMAFVFALAALLIAIQVRSLHLATREAASAYMDATSTKVIGRLQTEVALSPRWCMCWLPAQASPIRMT
jgi:adenylate cyclase